ncbi:hypothetical protein L596_027655 [Steinernema carpocapsae]|uniref:Tyrosine-protein phosphatase domain-containing protein n=1 Tax=Steinernema carpocapsae TaxID=34508 RepID=A0A4U5LW75_STECR|nr:hypothetical protein L596_027655 [Steinernema carpocapsae]
MPNHNKESKKHSNVQETPAEAVRKAPSPGVERCPTGATSTSAASATVHSKTPKLTKPPIPDTDEHNATDSSTNSNGGSSGTSTSESSNGIEATLTRKQRKANILKNVRSWIERSIPKGVEGLKTEFAHIPPQVAEKSEIKAFLANSQTSRSRFRDVPCLDSSRVVLKDVPNDFIHANFMETPRFPRRFICTQAPMESTPALVDFWHMVQQEEVEYIVMLCDFVEHHVAKSAVYFPMKATETEVFGNFEITNLKERTISVVESSSQIIQSTLRIRSASGLSRVTHFRWSGFPENEFPIASSALLAILRNVRGSLRPIVVHSSSGVGRAPVLVAIEFLQERLEAGQPLESLRFLLSKFRRQRALCIPSAAHFLYIHRVMLVYFLEKNLLKKNDEITKFIVDYDALVGQPIK